MVEIVKSISENFNYVFHDLADPRTQNWWGVSNPIVVLSIVGSYLYFCTSLGPRLMKDREPFKLKGILLIYNSFQVLWSIYLFYMASQLVFSKDFTLGCIPIDYTYSPQALLYANVYWLYFFAKITELLDTVFFVLRKKSNQISFLHVYHHSVMCISVWIGVKYFPGGGHALLLGYLNIIVHIFMYAYYLIAGLGPQFQKYIFWKKHLTIMQLVQFCIIFVHNFSALFYECNLPKWAHILLCINSIVFIHMFGQFYIKSYNKNKRA